MEIKLSNKDKKKVSHYKPLSEQTYQTRTEYLVCKDYKEGMLMSDIMKKYHISSGLCQTIINTYGRLNRHKKLKVEQRVQHVINDTKVLNNLIEDYQFMKNADIYEKYNIHKNGLYYILDKYKVPRKKDAKDLILQTVQVQE